MKKVRRSLTKIYPKKKTRSFIKYRVIYIIPTEEKNNVIYKIPCKDCVWNYIGETGRSLKTREAEHIRNVKKHNSGSNIAKHAWDNDHVIDFDCAKVIDIGNFRSIMAYSQRQKC